MATKVAILGAGSCFGVNLAACLLDHGGYDLLGIGRSPWKPECFTLGVKYPYHVYHINREGKYVVKLIHDFEPDVIVNFAAQGEGAASWGADAWRFFDTNTTALSRLCLSLDRSRFGRFIQVGSSEVYGSRTAPAKEDDAPTPTSPYGVSKAAFDEFLRVMWARAKFPSIVVRPCNAYCPGQQLHRVIPRAMIYGSTGRKLPLHGGGKSRKTWLHATDVSRAIMLLFKGDLGGIYNVGADEPTSVREVMEMCAKTLGLRLDELVEGAGERFGQDDCYYLDSSKIKALGWRQTIGWQDGLMQMRNWVHAYPEITRMSDQFAGVRE